METSPSMQIKKKYGLVHVPSMRKCRSWAEEVHKNRAARLPPEHAGMQAARTVFPYEAREYYPADALPVEEILAGLEE